MAKLISARLSRSFLHTSRVRGMAAENSTSQLTRASPLKTHEDMDFAKAVKILLSPPPRRRKFGLDFHLWQLFVACLPPFAVYLTALYARSEMRRLEKKLRSQGKDKHDTGKAEELSEQHDGDRKLEHPVVTNANEVHTLRARLDVIEKKVDELAHTIVDGKRSATGATVPVDRNNGTSKENAKHLDPTKAGDKDADHQKHKHNEGTQQTVMPVKQSNSSQEECK